MNDNGQAPGLSPEVIAALVAAGLVVRRREEIEALEADSAELRDLHQGVALAVLRSVARNRGRLLRRAGAEPSSKEPAKLDTVTKRRAATVVARIVSRKGGL